VIDTYNRGSLFQKCGDPICDIIIINRFPLVFGEDKRIHDAAMKAFFLSQGVRVAHIGDTAKKDGKASIKLDDAANEFNSMLVLNLELSIKKLRERMREAATREQLSQE